MPFIFNSRLTITTSCFVHFKPLINYRSSVQDMSIIQRLGDYVRRIISLWPDYATYGDLFQTSRQTNEQTLKSSTSGPWTLGNLLLTLNCIFFQEVFFVWGWCRNLLSTSSNLEENCVRGSSFQFRSQEASAPWKMILFYHLFSIILTGRYVPQDRLLHPQLWHSLSSF